MTCVKSKGRRRSRAVLALGLAVVFLCAALAAVTYEAIYPSASGSKTYKSGGAVLDVSNASQGYVMVKKQSKKRLKVRITAPPVEGAANEALAAFLAGALGLRKRDVTIAVGERSRLKHVRIRGLSAQAVAARLAPP